MKNNKTRFITRTAILLALTLVFQLIGRYIPLGPNSNFIAGPLVNACLIVSTILTGIWGGTIIAILAPFGAVITGAAIPLFFVPFIAIGNFILVLFIWLFKKQKIAGILSGAVLKFGFLYAAIAIFLGLYKVADKLAGVLYFSFSWPQLVTAIVGGVIALVVLKPLEKNIRVE